MPDPRRAGIGQVAKDSARTRPGDIGEVDDCGPSPIGSCSPESDWIGHTSRVGQDDASAGGPRAGLGVRSNLPAEISTFVGRAGDLARCADLLRRGRLLTLTGAGGAGKTRLALRLAAMLAARFPGGVWWIDLAPLTGPEAVTGAVARAVPAVPAGADLDVMAEVLGEAGTLLVLDNWPIRGWLRSTALVSGPNYPTPSKCWGAWPSMPDGQPTGCAC